MVQIMACETPLAIVCALVKFTSKGPIFYRQERMGLDGKSFTIVKFRSMYDEAEKHTGPVWAVQGDPRVTPLGRFMRHSNVDELPQLWNVLMGEMSIVGPRPERPHFVEQFRHKIPQYMLRHKVKAAYLGWTGDGHIGRLNITHAFYQAWFLHLLVAFGLTECRAKLI